MGFDGNPGRALKVELIPLFFIKRIEVIMSRSVPCGKGTFSRGLVVRVKKSKEINWSDAVVVPSTVASMVKVSENFGEFRNCKFCISHEAFVYV